MLVIEKTTDLLADEGWATEQTLEPDTVAIDMRNRSKMGVIGTSMNTHIGNIVDHGFSFKKITDATAIEPPSHATAEHKEQVEFQQTQIDLADGLLPVLKALKALSIGGGHTNSGLRALKGLSLIHI